MAEKLVRDRIPELIRSSGRTLVVRVAADGERLGLLIEKLREECAEFEADRSVEELADILEVVYALAGQIDGATPLEQLRVSKRDERGGFDAGYVLEI